MNPYFKFAAYDIQDNLLPFECQVDCCEEQDELRFKFTVCNTSDAAVYPALFQLLEWDSQDTSLHVFKPGFNKPSDNAWFYTAQVGKPLAECNTYIGDCLVRFPKSSLLISTMSAMQLSKEEWMLWGFTTFEAYHGVIEYDIKEKSVVARAWLEGEQSQFDAGVWVDLEEIVIKKGCFVTCMDHYADRLIALHGRRTPVAMSGWSDWEYYRIWGKNENIVLESAETLSEMKKNGWDIESVVVDAGWCRDTYSWDIRNEKFPNGAEWLCGEIKEKDALPGLWIAPWLLSSNSPVAKEHPEWLLRNRSDNEIRSVFRTDGEYIHTIDFSVPGTVEWFRGQIRMMLNWGYRYFKLDGPVFRHYDNTVFKDPYSTRYRQINTIMRLLREECGDDVFIESEGVYGPAIGVADFHRVTQDEHPNWYSKEGFPRLAENTPTTLCSALWNGKLWSNLNLLVLRDAPTPYMEDAYSGAIIEKAHEHLLTEVELQANLTSVWFTCSAIFYSAPLALTLKSEIQTEYFRRVVPAGRDIVTYPIDVEKDCPMIYRSTYGDRKFLHVYNLGEAYENKITVNLEQKYHVYDYWNERYLGIMEGDMIIYNLAPRSCRLYWLTPVGEEICLVGASGHIAGKDISIEIKEDGTVQINAPSFIQTEQSVTLVVPDSVSSETEGVLCDNRQKGIVKVWFTQGKKPVILKSNRKE